MNVFLSAGEASGDAYAAAFVLELTRLSDSTHSYAGMGGQRFKQTGAKVIADSSSWGAISILEALKVYPRVVASYYQVKKYLRTQKPGLFVPIDFGYVNIRLARHAKNHGWKVLYFVPPGSWRKDRQGKDLGAISDAISTPFSWSAELLNQQGAKASWFGHPIKQLLRNRQLGVAPTQSERIAVLPGSRSHEIDQNLPLLASAVDSPIEFGLAPAIDVDAFKAQWEKLAPGRKNDQFSQGDVYRVLTQNRAAVVCSGTATLEAALCRCPMVVIYKFPKSAELEAKLVGFKRPQFVALPNILLGRQVVPELIQEFATPKALKDELAKILANDGVRDDQIRSFDELDEMLGPSDAITQTALLAIELIKEVHRDQD